MSTEKENLAETLAREMKLPIEIGSQDHVRRIALPPGWKLEENNDEKLLAKPIRKTARVRLHDAETFSDYVKRHGSLSSSTVWCQANYVKGEVNFLAILNDNGESEDESSWRDHTAKFTPAFSEEWNRWAGSHAKPMSQAEFATFLEDNLRDVTGDGVDMPSGSQMLTMASNFEAKQDMRFKSAIRLQSGTVELNFIDTEDDATVQKMSLFDRFAIGIPVFWNGDAYRIDAKLRYRQREGKLTFWYDLIRKDKTLEAATKTVIDQIKKETGSPLFFGDPFAT